MVATGLVDWRGKPIDKKVHGGVRAAWFLYCMSLIYQDLLLVLVCSTASHTIYLHCEMCVHGVAFLLSLLADYVQYVY